MNSTIDVDALDVTTLDRVYTREGWCGGPRFGEVYRLMGGAGFVGGYRSTACRGLGLMGRRHFTALAKAKEYACAVSQGH